MEKQNSKSRKDVVIISAILGLLTLAGTLTASSISSNAQSMILGWLALCFVVGLLGIERKIGYGWAFIASFFLSPLVGFVLTMVSPKFKDEEYKQKMFEVADRATSTLAADQLFKLNELRKEGVLTEEEFQSQKQKILNT